MYQALRGTILSHFDQLYCDLDPILQCLLLLLRVYKAGLKPFKGSLEIVRRGFCPECLVSRPNNASKLGKIADIEVGQNNY